MATDDLRARFQPVDAWPGLARLWIGGQVGGLGAAFAFTLLLNATLVNCLIWTELATTHGRAGLAIATALAWLVGGLDSVRFRMVRRESRYRDASMDLFFRARAEYLQGEWVLAEQHLDQMVVRHPQDIAARLLLATLLRHQDRFTEAREQLRRLQRWRAAASWNMEIRREWEQLAKREFSADTNLDTSGVSGAAIPKVSQIEVHDAA